ncbi:acetyltransferase [Nostoc sp. CCY0012]|uniref:acetyltransferase n=1 Tax=Nostoc sp. CCY0012 TaxID=1056123 RepID=UPI0039C678EB
MFKPRTIFSAFTAIILAFVLVIQVDAQPALATLASCSPTAVNRPICPSTAAPASASFIDPAAIITNPANITLGEKVYVAPFARLNATNGPIIIHDGSNIQDQVSITPSVAGATIGERVILAHLATVKGTARIGLTGSTGPFTDPVSGVQFSNTQPETFIAFNAEVDGATIEFNTVVNFLSRVGPGVTLPSGKVVLPGKNVTSNIEATSGSLGKVSNLTQADVALMQGVIAVNQSLAQGYTQLAVANPSNVTGINFSPSTPNNPTPSLPTIGGVTVQDPSYPNRIIGNVILQDSLAALNQKLGNRISIRADEGQPFNIGILAGVANDVVFHGLATTNLTIGNGNGYGPRVLVHGGRQVVNGVDSGPETRLGNDVGLAPDVVIFRADIGNRSAVGRKSGVFNSTLPARTHIRSRIIYADNGSLISRVEW